MNNQLRSSKFGILFDRGDPVYGSKQKQAALFEDVIAWPDPDTNTKYYETLHNETQIEKTFKYNVNSLAMREPKFEKSSEMLAVGCSHSFGVGLPYNLAWPEVVSKELNIKYSNISKPGTSVMYQIINIFHYCQTFGNPKIILCMFPNFERSRIFVDNKTIYFNKEKEVEPQPSDIHTNALQDRPTFLKLPVNKDELISEEQAFYYNNVFIFMLEQYCRSNGIKLIWSTWANHNAFDEMFKKTFEYYKSNELSLLQNSVDDCYNHEDLREKYPKIFDVAADYYKGNGHFGVHWHQHAAEFFIDKIKEDLS